MPLRCTPLNAPVGRIYAHLENKNLLPRDPKLRYPGVRNTSNKYCDYHRDYGHDTDDCRQLKVEIEKLIQRGHLREYTEVTKPIIPKKEEPSEVLPKANVPPLSENKEDEVPRRVTTIAGGPGPSWSHLNQTPYRRILSLEMLGQRRKKWCLSPMRTLKV